LMLAGAGKTSIVGFNGVLNRGFEDRILPHWVRHPNPPFGTVHRILNLVVGLQLFPILLSLGHSFFLGEADSFVVMWTLSVQGVAVLVVGYKQAGGREFRVPFNFKIRNVEIPGGLGLITVTLVALCVINLLTKQVATISGVIFTVIFFAIFTVTERTTR